MKRIFRVLQSSLSHADSMLLELQVKPTLEVLLPPVTVVATGATRPYSELRREFSIACGDDRDEDLAKIENCQIDGKLALALACFIFDDTLQYAHTSKEIQTLALIAPGIVAYLKERWHYQDDQQVDLGWVASGYCNSATMVYRRSGSDRREIQWSEKEKARVGKLAVRIAARYDHLPGAMADIFSFIHGIKSGTAYGKSLDRREIKAGTNQQQ